MQEERDVRRSFQEERVGSLLVERLLRYWWRDTKETTAVLEDSTHHVGMEHVRHVHALSEGIQ